MPRRSRPPIDEPLADAGGYPRPPVLGRARSLARAIAVDRTPLRVSGSYRRMWWAEMVSQAGHQVTVVALFYQVYALTGSAAKVGLIGLVQFVPLMMASIVFGPLIDRLDRRSILLVTQIGFVGTSGVLLAGSLMDRPSLWLIYGAAAASAALSGVASPTRSAITPNLIPVELLSSAVALNQVMWNAAQIAGPAVGGVIIAQAGLAWAYGLDVVTYAATIYAVVRLEPQRPRGASKGVAGAAAIAEAFAFVRRSRVLQATFVVDLVAMIFGLPRALFPILAVEQFGRGPEIVGALFSAIGVGAVVGAATAGWVRRVQRQGLAVLVAVAGWGAAMAAFGVSRWLPLAFVLLALAGAFDVISAVFRGTILQASVTDAVRGRLSAIHILVVTGGPRLGDLEAGLVAAAFSPVVSVVSGGLACIVGVALLALWIPEFAAYRADARAETIEPSDAGGETT